jgi:glutamine---fructose-6-phosphate transaminase (isomerizing)
MCGIFGFISGPESEYDLRRFGSLISSLFLLSESRGKDASGLMLLNDSEMKVLKRPSRARKFVTSEEYAGMVRGFSRGGRRPGETLGFMGHARMVTNGSEETHDNNQPITRHGMCMLHNGIIVNDLELWREFPEMGRNYEVDTEVALALIQAYRNRGNTLLDAFRYTFCHLQGANSLAFISPDEDVILLATSNGSLYFSVSPGGRELLFSSERYILEKSMAHPSVGRLFHDSTVKHVSPGEGFLFHFQDLSPRLFMAGGKHTGETAIPPGRTAARSVRDLRPAREGKIPLLTRYAATDVSDNDRLIGRVNESVSGLRRCTKCVLPETFPYIEFDESGVCNYCRDYIPLHFRGAEALEELVRPFRCADGRPDCLVPLSGGRDSSYGIHYIKNVLGMHPVTFTYDWGMVTDLARRNISRMCGALGVEHILLSADIKTKRKYIRQNVLAWLRHPVLGTVPLFMAGDKQFFYYAQMLRKQMGIDLVLFSFNRLERTGFKIAFADIDASKTWQKYDHNFTGMNKLQLASFYAKEYILNPAYINSSIPDTLFAYFSYYLVPKSFDVLYDYIRWDEDTINRTLKSEYDWETARDTHSTWRIGDGTAAFYNYIYYVMAGFTENDTFHSNQIREGMLSREMALQIVESENQPRYESIQWYCDTIGIDMATALNAINRAPRLFHIDD